MARAMTNYYLLITSPQQLATVDRRWRDFRRFQLTDANFTGEFRNINRVTGGAGSDLC